jgi:hypothetical protein
VKRAFDPTAVRKILQRGIESGLWTLEDLDRPPPGYQLLCDEMAQHKVIELRSFKVPPYTNLLRAPAEAVQVSDPRDFTPTTGATPAQALDLPLTTEDPLDELPF